ncbi:MAG: ABC-F family ATP-binding cassette domain-containing protein [Spirochaetaceae bacterium]|nr:ABC-F family ATP-binding cassette domain-containing protein [Spirochaetaceae bacterium]
MAFVQFTQISLAFGDRDLLKNISLHLSAGTRAALAGANGSGKSTLMKILAGKINADSGERSVQKGSRISYLPQSGIVHQGKTVREEAESAYEDIHAVLSRMETLGSELEEHTEDSPKTRLLLEEYHALQEEVERRGYYRREQNIAMIFGGLGFNPEDMEKPAGTFSGGWQMRIALAKVLLEYPDILLLDEPTNYLDIEARTWLETWLSTFSGGCLLVSHDRYFLDVSVNEVYELFRGELKRYAGNYSAYEKIRAAELESLVKRYNAQQEEIARAEDLIRRFRYKATKAAMVQERIKKLEKMERIEIPESLKKMHINFPPPPHTGRIVLTVKDLSKQYGEKHVIENLELLVEAQEKLLVVGPNGAGKTTLLRIISGVDSAFTGNCAYGSGVQSGYFSQDAAETLQGVQTVLEYTESEAPTELIPKVRDLLGAFLFRGDDVYKSLSVLSGGEKSRLALLRLLLRPVNLLILDEPTNHLDIHSKDVLLETLKAYTGTVIFVSHDRAFMEALSTKTLELGRTQTAGASTPFHRLFYGNYAYYLDRIERETLEGGSLPPSSIRSADSAPPLNGAPPRNAPPPSPNAPGAQDTPVIAPNKTSALNPVILIKAGTTADTAPLSAAKKRELDKQKQALIRRLSRQEEDILKTLETLETEKAALETELSLPEVYSSGEKARAAEAKLKAVLSAIEEKNTRWEATAAELEAAKSAPLR